jgi:two-component system chemotaxis response regulator CheB
VVVLLTGMGDDEARGLLRKYVTSEPTPWRRASRPVWSGACQAVKLGGVDKIVPLAEVAATVLTLVER